MNKNNSLYINALFFLIILIFGCGNDDIENNNSKKIIKTTDPTIEQLREAFANVIKLKNIQIPNNNNQQIQIENKHYLFDVTEHTIEELEDLLSRIAEVTEASPEAFNDLEIIMVLHGPDIDYFTKKNYLENKSIVDLAAKLDAFNTIDMKVCKTTMNSLGFELSELPEFIEPVPFAPKTISSYKEQGYINL